MMQQIVLLVGLGVVLASCAGFGQCPGYGSCTGHATAGVYDTADLYLDKQGFPLPGYAYMRFPTYNSGTSR